MMEMFYICAVQHSNHWPPVAIEPMKSVYWAWETGFYILFNFY